jgi:transposase-like protein
VKKTGTGKTETEGREENGTVVEPRLLQLAGILVDARDDLRSLVMSSGIQVLQALLESDRETICGPRSRPQVDRPASRYGYDEGTVVLGGRKVRVKKPRVRGSGGEIELPSWRRFSNEDPLGERVVEQMILGVSTRGYARSLEAPAEGQVSIATSRASVSRRFVARTTAQVEAFLGQSLAKRDIVVVMMDGTHVGDHVLVVAIGIDSEGEKHVLGVREGTTENAAVCSSLLSDLVGRGLDAGVKRLFVIDGGKGARKAIHDVFGSLALVQRCQVHKERNVLDHLPERDKSRVRAELRRAWKSDDQQTAVRRLHALARQLESAHPGAAASVREGLEETTTLIALRVAGALHRTLRSTNPIENMNGSFKYMARRVRRWSGGKMAERWMATALIEAEKKFRRVRGHKEMPALVRALRPEAVATSAVMARVA